MAAAEDSLSVPVYGVYEGCVGADASSVGELLAWYALQGYTPACEGQLGAKEASALYGVSNETAGGLRSIRLSHASGADHGLVRIMCWEKPHSGLGLCRLATRGGRWTASLTEDVTSIANRAEIASRARPSETKFVPPQWTVIYGGGSNSNGGEGPTFEELYQKPLVGVREMLFFRPLTRQVFFQRFDYNIPTYGTVDPNSAFRVSQTTHFGIIVQAASNDAPEITFYEDALGLLRARDCREATTFKPGGNDAATNIWEFPPDATGNYNVDFDDPRSSKDWKKARSGRLKIARYPPEGECRPPLLDCEDGLAASQPGALGLSLYTYRTPDIAGLRTRVEKYGATKVTSVRLNEFGEESFSFISPDGYAWNIVKM